jgi:hypothetical protein
MLPCSGANILTTTVILDSIRTINEHKRNPLLEGSMTDRCSSSATLPADRRGRLRNGAASGDFLAAPRCGARTRAGSCCRQPAMRNGRCRMHGGLSTGPRTAAGRARCAAARRTHGFYSAEIVALRRAGAAYCRRMDALVGALRARRTAGHGLLPPNRADTTAGRARARRATPSSTSSASLRLRGESSSGRSTSSAGHGVHPSFSTPAPRLGFVQRILLGGTALGLGLTVPPPAAAGHAPVSAGHGLLPSFSRRAG